MLLSLYYNSHGKTSRIAMVSLMLLITNIAISSLGVAFWSASYTSSINFLLDRTEGQVEMYSKNYCAVNAMRENGIKVNLVRKDQCQYQCNIGIPLYFTEPISLTEEIKIINKQ